ncbi:hypothetical protein [Streptomyces sp. MK7]|uniref:hypothetical protein n=1 Tax=Streptomyces sp. MK7 TaxID=3067635 RepID=UPI00292E2952|nr:hypothetical protein [Streptomyces sp. MK7]
MRFTTTFLAMDASRALLGVCALAVITIVGLGVLLPAVWSRDALRRASARRVLRMLVQLPRRGR